MLVEFNLLKIITLWLKKILHIHSKGEYIRTTSRVISPIEETLTKPTPKQEKSIVTPLEKEKPAKTESSEKETEEILHKPLQQEPEDSPATAINERSGKDIQILNPPHSIGCAVFSISFLFDFNFSIPAHQ